MSPRLSLRERALPTRTEALVPVVENAEGTRGNRARDRRQRRAIGTSASGPTAPTKPGAAQRESSELYPAFVELMPLGNRAEDFGVALQALDRGVKITDQESYDAFYNTIDPAWRREFHQRFYEVRAAFAAADPVGWRALMPPYGAFLEVLRRRAGDLRLAIASAKDRASVRALLESYGVADLFAPELILDKEAGVHKTSHLERLHRLLGLPYVQLTYVDDKVNHLDAVSRLGVRCALAAWGYNGPREQALARAHGHLVCSLDEAETVLFPSPRSSPGRT
jgi:phosphoglycolate phosphatase-like HAD superfamily hydrolase